MHSTKTSVASLFERLLDPASRPNPYPIYEQMLEIPVAQLDENYFLVSTYHEILFLLHDPSVGKDQRKSKIPVEGLRDVAKQWILFLDPPEHDRLRRLVMHQFTPERITGMQGRVADTVTQLLNAQRDQKQFDLVDAFSYPLPVTVICELLGVPREDETRFHAWADMLTYGLDPALAMDPGITKAFEEISQYMSQLIAERRMHPRDDLATGLALGNDPAGRMDDETLISTMILLLLAGHETTVNLITNSMLTLLRHPQELQKLRDHPERVHLVIEEVLRYDPPVQFATRFALTDMTLHGVTIPQGSGLRLMFAAGDRDPRCFAHPNEFDPDRPDNRHFGFGNGVHYCVGAPLARIEVQVALTELSRRLIQPRLVVDPPPYRANAVLRGPQHLPIAFDRMEA
ncbi:cytochrome P450 [Ktedonobacter racemifer]|uniref:Cytochrome P450 n=1 Tax=Ktedonobacter racemifer DSM 44963 TaxID=485913 RepID=D6U7Z7_KTERA|nr:cytochrome P450 [Ktedonobacter racemifer]EFH80008.1 cytochrome P450 [Ktedonobacter racemifer DSM 44963]